MLRTVEAMIDENGAVVLSEVVALTGPRRALVTILDEEVRSDPESNTLALLSESAMARYWASKEEDAAWAHLKDLPALDDDE